MDILHLAYHLWPSSSWSITQWRRAVLSGRAVCWELSRGMADRGGEHSLTQVSFGRIFPPIHILRARMGSAYQSSRACVVGSQGVMNRGIWGIRAANTEPTAMKVPPPTPALWGKTGHLDGFLPTLAPLQDQVWMLQARTLAWTHRVVTLLWKTVGWERAVRGCICFLGVTSPADPMLVIFGSYPL